MLNTANSPKSSVSPFGSLLSLAFLVLALTASLFFQKVNAEYFALAGLSLVASFALALWLGRPPSPNLYGLPLALLFTFWAWIGIATMLSPVTFISLGTFWTIAFLPLAALTVVLVAGFHKFETYTIYALMAVVATLAVYACVRFLVFDEAPRATFANKNNLAALQMPMAFFTSAFAVTSRRFILKAVFLVLTALFVFTIGVIGSRGVLVCLLTGFVLIVGVLFMDKWQRKAVLTLMATFTLALVASNNLGSVNLAQQAETMLAPSSAGSDRFIIWQGSMELAEETPWHGIGPGLFPMVYPQYRLDEDRSAAFFVHNDYFQFYIEAGWPSAALLVAALISLAFIGVRRAFNKQTTPQKRLAIIVPLLGTGAIAGHSMLSFNLFLPSLLIMAGIMFGLTVRHSQTLAETTGKETHNVSIPKPIAAFLILLSAAPALFFVETGRGALLHKQANALKEENRLPEAIQMLERAAEISPNADIYHYSLTWLEFQTLASGKEQSDGEFFKRAMARLNKAEQLNPLRPQVHIIRARILEALGNPETGATWKDNKQLRDEIEEEYRKAVSKDPFHLEGRFYLARFLLQQNQLEKGLAVLEDGIEKPYSHSELSVNYYRLTAEMRRILGDQAGYQALMERLKTAIEKKRRQGETPAPGS